MTDPLIGATTAVFAVTLSVALSEPVDVAWATKDGSGKAGVDYEAANGVVTFLPGETAKQIQVTVYGREEETGNDDRTFYIALTPPTNAVLGNSLVECIIKVEDESGVPITTIVVAQGKRGFKGDPGLSAYEQAVLMGYEGTVEQWMDEIADASQAAERAKEAETSAAASASQASAAAAAAAFAGRIYPTPAAGVDPVTGVPNGAYYNVRSSSNESFIDEYQNVNGVATPTGKSFPSSQYVQSVAEYVALPYKAGATYGLDDRVTLSNGDIVRSTEANNTTDPNTDMSKWVRVGNLIIAMTVAEMSSKKLKDGDLVRTIGYYNIFDEGGATYLISAAATDYSIPLGNELHAVLRDSFDIRKFGIRNDATIDQTTEITRMVNYADTREYVIDFHNYAIMTPQMSTMGISGVPIKGMIFHNVHDLQNLNIANDKVNQLQQNTSCIAFVPKVNTTVEKTFKLSRVTFDPYVANYNITNGQYDGNMHGFIAHPHVDSGIFWSKVKTMYSFEFENIEFASAAICYNLTTSAVWAERNVAKNLRGDYIGLFYNHFADHVDIDDVDGVYRDDLHAAGRVLVTNLIHEEPEAAATPIATSTQKFSNLKVVKYSNGAVHNAIKYHSVITPRTIGKVELSNIDGNIQYYSPITGTAYATINELSVKNQIRGALNLEAYIKDLKVSDTKSLSAGLLRPTAKFDAISLSDLNLSIALSTSAYGASSLPVLNLTRVAASDATYGIVRNPSLSINTINMKDCELNVGRAVECVWGAININGLKWNVAAANSFFLRGSTSVGVINARNLNAQYGATGGFYHFMADTGASLTVNNAFSDFNAPPAVSNATFNSQYSIASTNKGDRSATLVYDPPSIAAGATASTTVSLPGAVMGDLVVASVNRSLAGLLMWAYVSAADTVTVYFKNETAAAIDLAQLTIKVKIV